MLTDLLFLDAGLVASPVLQDAHSPDLRDFLSIMAITFASSSVSGPSPEYSLGVEPSPLASDIVKLPLIKGELACAVPPL